MHVTERPDRITTWTLELILRALMLRDAKIWAQRQLSRESAIGPPDPADKIEAAKKRSYEVRLARIRADRIAVGLPTRASSY